MRKFKKINEWLFRIVYGNPSNPLNTVGKIPEGNGGEFRLLETEEKLDFLYEDLRLASEVGFSSEGGTFSVNFRSKGAHFFGFGEKMGQLDKRGSRMKMVNYDNPLHTPNTDPMYVSIPFFIIAAPGKPAMGIFANTTSYSGFDMTGDDYRISVMDEGIELYAIYGPKVSDIVERFTELTGRMEMPPAWSLGYQQSRWSYATAGEALEVAGRMRKDSIPCDVIYLDIDYMKGYRVFTWGDGFEDPKAFAAELKKMGFKLVTIVDPGVKIDGDYGVYRSGKEAEVFVKTKDGEDFVGYVWPGRCNFPDFTRTDVREWWADNHKPLFDAGVDGIWNDMNEPAIVWTDEKTSKIAETISEGKMDFEVLGKMKELFSQEDYAEVMVHEDDDGKKWPHRKIRNVYALMEAMATVRAFEKYRPSRRPFVLTRAGFAGIQRYSAVWTGDNSSWWEHLEAEMPISMGLGLSGVSFTGADIGGFGGDATPELLIRWAEMGAYFPFFRNHSAIGTVRQEPWAFGSETEEIVRKHIRKRYELFPQLYTEFYNSHKTGLPIMRPLFMTDQDDPELYSVNDEFTVGDSLLVAPVTKPNSTWRAVYIPKGKWIDIRDGKVYEEGHVYKVNVPLDEIAVFVRENSMIFRTDPMEYIFDRNDMNLYADLYGREAIGRVYEDDGETLGYKEGKYNLYEFSAGALPNGYSLNVRALRRGYEGRYRHVVFSFMNTPHLPKVIVNGKELESHFEGEILKVEFDIGDVI